jgi:Fur family ferric uptake transcriptional regulator
MDDIREILKEKGYRATAGRVRLLQILKNASKPMSIRDILKRAKGGLLDQVTLYRALESLSERGIVNRADLNSGIVHYEYTGAHHHHHIVCTDCGAVEDFWDKLCDSVEKKAIRKSNSFKTISSHSMELFGICANCS